MKASLTTQGSISTHLIRLTLPTIGGFVALTAFNMTDTYFVSRLGTNHLAAMGFTFPVVMIIGAIAIGISMGAGSLLGRAMGSGDKTLMRRTATNGLLLALVTTALVGVVGLFTMDPLFLVLGADSETLPLVKEYMTIWYLGCVVVVAPPVADANLRATGDMIRPSIVMITCAVFNIILDPLLIFGFGPIPAMEMAGASLATVIARGFGMAVTLTFNARSRLLDPTLPKLRKLLHSWKNILYIGLPTALIQLMPSALRSVLTAMTSQLSSAVGVAALAAGNRIEYTPFMVAVAANHALLVVTSQNAGANLPDRLASVRLFVTRFSVGYGLFLAAGVWVAAPYVAPIFSKDPAVINLTTIYLRVLFLSSFGTVMLTCTSSVLNGLHRPLVALTLNIISYAFLMIPGAYAGSLLLPSSPFTGMVIGVSAGTALSGIITWGVGLITIPGKRRKGI